MLWKAQWSVAGGEWRETAKELELRKRPREL